MVGEDRETGGLRGWGNEWLERLGKRVVGEAGETGGWRGYKLLILSFQN